MAALARELTEGPQKLEKINMLVLTAGILSMQGRTETEEGSGTGDASQFATCATFCAPASSSALASSHVQLIRGWSSRVIDRDGPRG